MEGTQGAVFAMAGTVALVLFAIYARSQEPERYRRAAPWIMGALLIVGVLSWISALQS